MRMGAALLLALALGAGCSDNDDPTKDLGVPDITPDSTKDVGIDLPAVNPPSPFDRCYAECSSSNPCAGGEDCKAGVCLPTECTGDADCAWMRGNIPDIACVSNLYFKGLKMCLEPCTTDADCSARTPTCLGQNHCATAEEAQSFNCKTDTDCTATADTTGRDKCNVSKGICECTDAASCEAARPVGQFKCQL